MEGAVRLVYHFSNYRPSAAWCLACAFWGKTPELMKQPSPSK